MLNEIACATRLYSNNKKRARAFTAHARKLVTLDKSIDEKTNKYSTE